MEKHPEAAGSNQSAVSSFPLLLLSNPAAPNITVTESKGKEAFKSL